MKKHLCVFGVLKTLEGIQIKNEMLKWLNDKYEVLCIEQEPPGVLFEYPGIKYAAKLSIELNEPVLYIHTKGAANPNKEWFQPLVRTIWQQFYSAYTDKIFDIANNTKEPLVQTLFTGDKRRICWFNTFVMNQSASKIILEKLRISRDRYYYENMFAEMPNIKILAHLHSFCNTPADIINLLKKYQELT